MHRTPQPGVMMALMTRMRDVDATDPEQLTRAEIEGRRQCREYFRFLQGLREYSGCRDPARGRVRA